MRSLAVSALISVMMLSACSNAPIGRAVADRLSSPAWMTERPVPALDLVLTAFEKMHTPGAPATIYIEGEGLAVGNIRTMLVGDGRRLGNPTPINPVAMHLATRDRAENVAYLAQPCQYTNISKEDDSITSVLQDKAQIACELDYRGDNAYSQKVVDSYSAALDNIKARYGITAFNLVGYEGGGAIAALLAAQRHDVLSLRTVAGIMDTTAFTAYHDVPALRGSINPVDRAASLKNLPQIHYIAGQDTVVPPAIVNSYLQALGDSTCADYMLIQGAGHDEGWVDKWPDLLQTRPTCGPPALPVHVAPEPVPAHPYAAPERPEKP